MRMLKTRSLALCAFVAALGPSVAVTQQPPAIRQIGRLERVSTDSLASAATVVQLRDGRVLVHDITSRRVLLFDSSLAHATVVADTTIATGNAYSRQSGTLIRYRGDTALFIDVGSLSMLVIGPSANIVRVMAIPRPDDAQHLIGAAFGQPGFDARGRLIYHTAAGLEGNLILCCVEHPGRFTAVDGNQRVHPVPKPDSGLLVRVDLATRTTDTLASIRIAQEKQRVVTDDQGYVQSIERVPMPAPIVDTWAVTADGSLAVVRGRDYHVDWLSADGRWTSTPKLPFSWVRRDDARKLALIDSTAKAEQAIVDRMNATRASPPGGASRGGGGGRGGGGAATTGRGGTPIPAVVVRAEPADVADYAPAFSERAATADDDGNVWIRTTTIADARPVYDVVNRRGELFDRVQLPAFRTIAGFGPGVIYMAVKDSSGVVHLERARVR